MIRYFEIFGIDDEPEYFGFLDTVTTTYVKVDGQSVFCDYEDFLSYANEEPNKELVARLIGLMPRHGDDLT